MLNIIIWMILSLKRLYLARIMKIKINNLPKFKQLLIMFQTNLLQIIKKPTKIFIKQINRLNQIPKDFSLINPINIKKIIINNNKKNILMKYLNFKEKNQKKRMKNNSNRTNRRRY